jgi:pimeloyl-ACP methyl ester carboxylesterase
LKLGATCLTFDLGGHGRSGTQPEVLSARDHLLDTIAAYDALVASQHVDPARVGVCGASYGAYLAALIVAQRPVRRLLLRAPALYPDDWLDTPIGRRGPLGTTPTNSAALESLRQFGGEVLVLESGCDEAIPKDMIQAYLHACRSPVHDLIPEATHQLTDPLWKELFLQRIVEWFGPL